MPCVVVLHLGRLSQYESLQIGHVAFWVMRRVRVIVVVIIIIILVFGLAASFLFGDHILHAREWPDDHLIVFKQPQTYLVMGLIHQVSNASSHAQGCAPHPPSLFLAQYKVMLVIFMLDVHMCAI